MWRTFASIVTLVAVAQTDAGTDDGSNLLHTSEFARALFNALGQANTSLMISPYSVSSSLILIPTYAEGETAAQILSALGMQLTDLKQIVQGIHRLNLALHEPVLQGLVKYLDPSFIITNGSQLIFLESIGHLAPHNETAQVGTYTPESVQEFVSQKTEGRVHIQMPLEALGVNRMVLVNAMVLQVQWRDRFHGDQTSKRTFKSETLEGYVDTEVDMMTGVRTVQWKRDDVHRVDTLELPLAVPDLVFAIVLPHDTEGLPELERQLLANGELLAGISQGLSQAQIRVGVPKFRLETTLYLKKSLKDLGITNAFDPIKADFRHIPDFENLYLYDMVHYVAIELNEEGIAVTTSSEQGTPRGLAPTEPSMEAGQPVQSLVADHPFLFFVKHITLGQVLVAGKYLGP